MDDAVKTLLNRLIERGVEIPHPASVMIGDDVSSEQIAPDSKIYPGCRIAGADTSIGPGSEVGREAPATVVNCQLGRNVQLKGGYFEEATFLDGASMGSCAHVRGGTLIEEQAGGAHSVGLKQTVLLPFVTLGSLINFCDCLMAGGTSRRNHSEVGSSYIHFNFTPHGDKATPSLIGDVPRGVLLDQPPVFLGGQGGLVGPARIEFGVVIPAGAIWRKNALDAGSLHIPRATRRAGAFPYNQGLYRSIDIILQNNLIYIGNIFALKCWYTHVRSAGAHDIYQEHCMRGAIHQIHSILAERIRRLAQLAEKMELSLELAGKDPGIDEMKAMFRQQARFKSQWPEIKGAIESSLDATRLSADGELVAEHWQENAEDDKYIECVESMPSELKQAATRWLQTIVDNFAKLAGPLFDA